MNRTFGAPSLARLGSGHAGDDSSTVRPMVPVNADPGRYSFMVIPFSVGKLALHDVSTLVPCNAGKHGRMAHERAA